MADTRLSAALFDNVPRDRLLVLALAAALSVERAPWELIAALLYIAM